MSHRNDGPLTVDDFAQQLAGTRRDQRKTNLSESEVRQTAPRATLSTTPSEAEQSQDDPSVALPSVQQLWATQQQQQQAQQKHNEAILLLLGSWNQDKVCPPNPTLDVMQHMAPRGDNVALRLASYDPDASTYSMAEWLSDADDMRRECQASDTLMIHKAGEALRGRAKDHVHDWRPLRRTWDALQTSLLDTFPNQKPFGVLAHDWITLTSADCVSLCDYGTRKVRLGNRLFPDLSWSDTLSVVLQGTTDSAARASLHLQKPVNSAELNQLFSLTDAENKRAKLCNQKTKRPRSPEPTPSDVFRRTRSRLSQREPFLGTCFSCGRRGHRQTDCRQPTPARVETKVPPRPSALKCDHCARVGHTQEQCWLKNPALRPRKTFEKPAQA